MIDLNKPIKKDKLLVGLYVAIVVTTLLTFGQKLNMFSSPKPPSSPPEVPAQPVPAVKHKPALKLGEEIGELIKVTVISVTPDWKDSKLFAQYEKESRENAAASKEPPKLMKLVLVRYRNTSNLKADYSCDGCWAKSIWEVPALSCGSAFGESFVAYAPKPLPPRDRRPTYSDQSSSIIGVTKIYFAPMETKEGYISVDNDCRSIGPSSGSFWWGI